MDTQRAIRQLKWLEAHSTKPEDMRLAAESWASDFQILVSIIMSARTRDEVTIPVAEALFVKYPTAEKLAKAKPSDIQKAIRSVNFYRNKSKSILACAKMLISDFKGKVPHDIDSLVLLPGVGRKTANVFLVEVGKQGIGVDTHVAYISHNLGWTKNTKQEKIEQDLKKLFSQKDWNRINGSLVRFGKTHTSRRKKDALLDQAKKIK